MMEQQSRTVAHPSSDDQAQRVETELPQLSESIQRYQLSVEALSSPGCPGESKVLDALLARSRLDVAWAKTETWTVANAQQLVDLDTSLRREIRECDQLPFEEWRRSLQPPKEHGWWYLDTEARATRSRQAMLWFALTTLLVVLTLPLTFLIVRRLWQGSPGYASGIVIVLSLLVTGSPFTRWGQELAAWLASPFSGHSPRVRPSATTVAALVAFVVVLLIYVAGLPALARHFHDRGVDALSGGAYHQALTYFSQAAALQDTRAEPHYMGALAYEASGRREEALTWYSNALSIDTDFLPTYSSLSRLYNLNGEYLQAIPLLETGLTRLQAIKPGGELSCAGDGEELVLCYLMLSHLGWSYYEQGLPQVAESLLVEAVRTASRIPEAERTVEPHYFLALTYEALAEPEQARLQWQTARAFLRSTPDIPLAWQDMIQSKFIEE